MPGSTQQNAATLPSIADTLLAAATTRQSLYPELCQENILILIDKLHELEAVRKHVVASAKDAVVLRGKYKDMDVDNRTTALHRDRENLITELANNKRDTTLRLLYIQLVISLGRMVQFIPLSIVQSNRLFYSTFTIFTRLPNHISCLSASIIFTLCCFMARGLTQGLLAPTTKASVQKSLKNLRRRRGNLWNLLSQL
jgi:hypothetical protein